MLHKIHTCDMFGSPVTRFGEILGEAERGYDLPSGAWSAYPAEGATPATFLIIRWKGKRKPSCINKKDIERIE